MLGIGSPDGVIAAACLLSCAWFKAGCRCLVRGAEPPALGEGFTELYIRCMAVQVLAVVFTFCPEDMTTATWTEGLVRRSARVHATLCEVFAEGEGPPRPPADGRLQPREYFSGLRPERVWRRAMDAKP